ncbi:MAG: tetratricopeptide repeat protein, partial [Thermomicrobiales bacterium]
PWIDDFAAARNFSLGAAAKTGAAWAMNLDTDERIEPHGTDIRALLAEAETEAVFMGHAEGHSEKERFFRMPLRGAYHGPTHEAWWGGSRKTVMGPKFWEEAKDGSGIRHKLERDERILAKHTAENPTDPRWYYYYGDTLANLERHEEAIAAFEKVIELDGWDEEAGWAAYRAARILGDNLKRWTDAEAMCARGLTRHPAMVELYWCAGYSAYWGGKYARSVHWARVAVALNAKEDEGFIPQRGGFKYPPARREGPWDVLRHGLRQIGNTEGAEFAEKMHASYKNAGDAAAE